MTPGEVMLWALAALVVVVCAAAAWSVLVTVFRSNKARADKAKDQDAASAAPRLRRLPDPE